MVTVAVIWSALLGFGLVVVGCLERRAAYAADHRAVFDLLGGHVQLAGRLAGALDSDAAAAALLWLVLALAVLAVLSPARAVLAAAGTEGLV
jgi:hypothetical protein